MFQDSTTVPRSFVRVIAEVGKGHEGVAAYLDDVVVFDRICNFISRFRLPKHKSVPQRQILLALISPAGVSRKADKAAALTKIPMLRYLTRLRSLLGGLSYYRKFITRSPHCFAPQARCQIRVYASYGTDC